MGEMSCSHLNQFLSTFSTTAKTATSLEECSYCFATAKDGLNLCLNCLCCFCFSSDTDHSSLHFQKTDHSFYLSIQQTSCNSEESPLKKLAVTSSLSPSMTTSSPSIHCRICNFSAECKNEILLQLLTKPSSIEREINHSWEVEIKECPHSKSIQTMEKSLKCIPTCCSRCSFSENIWLCLGCGNAGCGRAYFDGSGGNNHAMEHYQQSEKEHHSNDACSCSVAVKIGTITKEGEGDAFCYACNDSVKVPGLIQALSRLGISGFESLKQSEKSTLQLELELNQSYTPSSSISSAQELSGPNLAGIANLGNTCYLSSALICLLKMKEVKDHFNSMGLVHMMSCSEKGTDCLFCQLTKICNALTTGEKGINPKMLKYIISKKYNAFQSNKQQDVHEFMDFLFSSISTFVPTFESQFTIRFINKMKCSKCCGVLLSKDESQFLLLTLSNSATVSMQQLVEIYFSPSFVTLHCSGCGNNEFSKQTFISALPPSLIVVACRYASAHGILQKNPIQIQSTKEVSLLPYVKSVDSEMELLDDCEFLLQSDFSAKNANEESLLMLMSMGFERDHCLAALKATGGKDLDAASNWLFDHPYESSYQQIPVVSRQSIDSDYKIESFLVHKGTSISSGHYIAYVCDKKMNKWICFNDSIVSEELNPPLQDGYVYFYSQ